MSRRRQPRPHRHLIRHSIVVFHRAIACPGSNASFPAQVARAVSMRASPSPAPAPTDGPHRRRDCLTEPTFMARSTDRLLVAAAALLLPTLVQAATLVPSWTTLPGGFVDGYAAGDVDGDKRLELAIVTRGGAYFPDAATLGAGTLALVDQNGQFLWQTQTGEEFVGIPTAADFDGDGLAEFAACEAGTVDVANPSAAMKRCHVFDNNGSVLYSTPPLWLPGMANGGPAAADLNGDNIADMIVVTYGGQVSAFAGPMGSLLWSQDLYTAAFGYELVFGHPAIGDLNGDGVDDVVITGWGDGGTADGGVHALNGANGQALWSIDSFASLPGNPFPGNALQFYGQGALIGDVDADGQPEVVVAGIGSAVSAAVALSTSGAVKWWATLPAGDWRFATPVASDADGDGVPEIYLQSLSGTIVQLAGDSGAVRISTSLGSRSWLTPALVDLSADGLPEVIAGDLSNLYVFDLAANPAVVRHNWSDPSAGGMYPAPLVTDLDGDGRAELIVATWNPQTLVRFDIDDLLGFDWPAWSAGPKHAGFLDVNDTEQLLGNDPVPALLFVFTQINNAIAGAPGGAQADLQNAANAVENAFIQYLNGNPHYATGYLEIAANALDNAAAAGANATGLLRNTVWVSLLIFEQYIDRTGTIVASNTQAVSDAYSTLATARNQWAAGNYVQASATSYNGANTLRNWLDFQFSSSTIVNNCPAGPGHVYQVAECLMLDVLDQTLVLNQQSNDRDVDRAITELRRGIAWMPDVVLENVYDDSAGNQTSRIRGAIYRLGRVNGFPNIDMRNQLCESLKLATRQYIDDVAVWRGANDPNVQLAETRYAQAVASQAAGNFNTSATQYRDAFRAARAAL
ncbi:MAG: hypothetical protein D6761_02090 [Candidatus Dadabacteria bacterium]|nr:MAG: hypothetical protein D6761_02090 [Candidatus Dadabacteria bacterium]